MQQHLVSLQADTDHFLHNHWFGAVDSSHRRRYLQTLLTAMHQSAPGALDSIIDLLRPAIAAEAARLTPQELPLKLVLQQTEYRMRTALPKIKSVYGIATLKHEAITQAIESAAVKLAQFNTPEAMQKLDYLNETFWELDGQLQDLMRGQANRQELAGAPAPLTESSQDWPTVGYSCHLLLDYYAPPQLEEPIFTEGFSVTKDGLQTLIRGHRFGSAYDWKPWPQLEDLQQPYHYLLYNLLARSPLLLTRVLEIEKITFRVTESQEWERESVF